MGDPGGAGGASAAALDGVHVLDLSSQLAGPLIATTLGDLGADVVKVEHPSGDEMRRWGPARDDIPLWWKVISRNKRLIALDLHEEGDREIVRQLTGWADVLVENFRPGRLESWGLGYDVLSELNSRLVMLRVTGFGQDGPMSSQPGFGTLAEAFSGYAAMSGLPDGPPMLPPFGLADGIAGVTGALAILAALRWRDQCGGRGQLVDLSLYEPLFSLLGPALIEYQQLGIVPRRQGNRSARTAPRNAYETADGHWIVLSAGTQQIANRVFRAIGRSELADDPRFATSEARRVNADEIDLIVADWISKHPQSEVLETFRALEAPVAPILTMPDIVEDPHYAARGSIVTAADPDLGEVSMQRSPLRLSESPPTVRWTGALDIDRDRADVLSMLTSPESPSAATTPGDDMVVRLESPDAAVTTSFEDVVGRRASCRGFRPDEVPEPLIRRLLSTAQCAPSWCNTQPWQVYVTTGERTESFRRDLLEHVDQHGGEARSDFARPAEYTGVRLERRRACGWALYEAVGITRGDRAASAQQARRNFELFGAPHVAIITSATELGVYGAVDSGIYLATFLYAAESLGLGAVAQAALANYSDFLRGYFEIPAEQQVLAGVSFGYRDDEHPANAFRTARAEVDDCVHWARG